MPGVSPEALCALATAGSTRIATRAETLRRHGAGRTFMTFHLAVWSSRPWTPSLPGYDLRQSPDSMSHSYSRLFKERCIEVGAMDLDVAQSACLKKCRLVVERWRTRRGAEGRCCVALQAQQVDVAEPEHVRIWPAM